MKNSAVNVKVAAQNSPQQSVKVQSLSSSAGKSRTPSPQLISEMLPWSRPQDPEPLDSLPYRQQILRFLGPYLLPNIFKLLHTFGHLLEAAINLTWPVSKTVKILPRLQISREIPGRKGMWAREQ